MDKDVRTVSRARISKTAVVIVLEALQTAGLPVDKVCINGGKIEVHIRNNSSEPEAVDDTGLKDW